MGWKWLFRGENESAGWGQVPGGHVDGGDGFHVYVAGLGGDGWGQVVAESRRWLHRSKMFAS